jgi:hypothetical protein
MQRLLEMVEALGPFGARRDNLIVSPPEVSDHKANTVVVIQGKFDTGTYGDFVFRYNRINLANLPQRTIQWDGQNEMVDLIENINQNPLFTYSIGTGSNQVMRQGQLLLQDIVNEPFTIASGEQKDLLLRANPVSYMYTGALRVKLVRA